MAEQRRPQPRRRSVRDGAVPHGSASQGELLAKGPISQLCSRKLSEQFSSAQSFMFPEPYPNQLPKYRQDKIVPRGPVPLRLNRADNLQMDRMKLAGNAELSWFWSWFKDSSPAEDWEAPGKEAALCP